MKRVAIKIVPWDTFMETPWYLEEDESFTDDYECGSRYDPGDVWVCGTTFDLVFEKQVGGKSFLPVSVSFNLVNRNLIHTKHHQRSEDPRIEVEDLEINWMPALSDEPLAIELRDGSTVLWTDLKTNKSLFRQLVASDIPFSEDFEELVDGNFERLEQGETPSPGIRNSQTHLGVKMKLIWAGFKRSHLGIGPAVN